MNSAHFHLAVAHLPIVGIPIALALLIFGIWKAIDALKVAGLVIIVFCSLCAIPVYLAGEGAEELVEDLPGVVESNIEEHEEVATISFIMTEVLGAFSLLMLAAYRLRGSLSLPLLKGATVLSLAVTVALGYTAFLGGHIRHTEIGAVGATSETEKDSD